MYLYTGNGVETPVKLTGNPSTTTGDEGSPSSVPAEIHTSPVTIDGTAYNYGTIMVGEGTIPSPYGSYAGEDYRGWVWSLNPISIQLTWANLNNKNEVIESVVGQFQGMGTFEVLPGGGYTTRCLSFVVPPGITAHWLRLNSAYDWVPVTTC